MMELSILTLDGKATWTLEEEEDAYRRDAKLMARECCPCGKPLTECRIAKSGAWNSLFNL